MGRPTSPPPREPDIIYDMDAFRRDFKRWMDGELISVDIRNYGTEVKYISEMRATFIEEGVSGFELIQKIKQSVIAFFDWLDITFIPERWYKEPEKFV